MCYGFDFIERYLQNGKKHKNQNSPGNSTEVIKVIDNYYHILSVLLIN